jgi:hypothetical protein
MTGAGKVSPDDIAAVLRIKRAREQSAEVSLRHAQAAQHRAATVRGRAEQAAAEFAAQRPGQEAAVHRMLSAGPIPPQRLRQAVAQLSSIAALEVVLVQRTAQAVQHETACAEASGTAQRAHAKAVRDSLAVATLHQRIDAAAQAAEEQSRDAELEEMTGRCDPVMRVPT